MSGTEGYIVSETMAARGLVNGRGPLRRSGRDSAKRVVSETISPLVPLDLQFGFNFSAYNFNITLGFTQVLADAGAHGYDELYARHLV